MTTKDKVARRKLSMLQLAQELNNVSRACAIMGHSRQQFYEIRRNFQTYGAEGLTVHDGARLTELLDPDAFASAVWADTAYRSAANEAAIRKAGRRSMIHFKKPKERPMPGPHQRANRARSKVRAAVEHVFGEQKARMRLTIRTSGLARAKTKIGLANLAHNMRRLVWLDAKTAPA